MARTLADRQPDDGHGAISQPHSQHSHKVYVIRKRATLLAEVARKVLNR